VNRRLITSALIVLLGGFVFGYDLGALSPASQSHRSAFSLSPTAFGLTISASLWGTVCGSLLSGWIADRTERRILIAACAAVYAVAALATFRQIPSEWILVLAIRFICGLAIGGFTVVCPLYLSEMAPISHRGRFVSLFQIQVGAGVVVAFFVGLLATKGVAAKDAWNWCLGTGSIPATLLLGLLMLLPAEKAQFSGVLTTASSVAGGFSGAKSYFAAETRVSFCWQPASQYLTSSRA
jgi:SP family arabinose:H+ symporter-like MFS transporter